MIYTHSKGHSVHVTFISTFFCFLYLMIFPNLIKRSLNNYICASLLFYCDYIWSTCSLFGHHSCFLLLSFSTFIHNYLEIIFPIDVLRFSEFRTMRNHLSETLMLNDIQITSDYISRWVVLKRRVGAVTSQRVLEVLSHLL